MIQFKYDSVMKRYNVRVPFTLAGETSKTTVASISENNKLTMHRELSIEFVRQILMHWDEQEHMARMKEAREAGELDELLNNNKKGDK